jgi:two-component system, cell cycle response regulator
MSIDKALLFLKDCINSLENSVELKDFYMFKDDVSHFQSFDMICKYVAIWFSKKFNISDTQVIFFDIETNKDVVFFRSGSDFCIRSNLVKTLDFSKSYEINGRLVLNVNDDNILEIIKDKHHYWDFVTYEISQILKNALVLHKLKENSIIDEVTSLPNRNFLIAHLNSTLPVAKKENLTIAFLKVSVDRFKAVVEEFDYEIGLKVLKLLSSTLEKNISTTDLLTRFEGTSFMIAMQDIKDECEAINLASKCIEDFAKKEVVVNQNTMQTLKKTICVGMAFYPKDGNNTEELFKNVNIALDEARNKGRSSYETFSKSHLCAVDLF